jgi:hypothetical protein
MWLQRFTNYLLEHRYIAIVLAFCISFVPIIGILGILLAALVTLRKGIVEGAILTVAATLPYLITFLLSGSNETAVPLVIWAVLGVAALSNGLTWAFAVLLRRQMSWSFIIQIAALIGVLVVSVVHLAYPGVAGWWGSQLQAYYAHAQSVTTSALGNEGAVVASNEAQLEAISITKEYATGLMAAGVLFNALLQLAVARWWLAIVFLPGSLRRELRGIRLSQLAGILFILSLVFSYLGNSVVLDIMPILYLLFGAAGLSLLHYLFGLMRSPTAWFWLLLMYITLMLSLPTSLVLVSILAVADIWLDLRKRFRKI